MHRDSAARCFYFYPRPPRGGRPDVYALIQSRLDISIHALREEGDRWRTIWDYLPKLFLSTPSARRATAMHRDSVVRCFDFYPRPPRGGRPVFPEQAVRHEEISIHALREEGDQTFNGD